jgi:hypothetical protein
MPPAGISGGNPSQILKENTDHRNEFHTVALKLGQQALFLEHTSNTSLTTAPELGFLYCQLFRSADQNLDL